MQHIRAFPSTEKQHHTKYLVDSNSWSTFRHIYTILIANFFDILRVLGVIRTLINSSVLTFCFLYLCKCSGHNIMVTSSASHSKRQPQGKHTCFILVWLVLQYITRITFKDGMKLRKASKCTYLH